MNLHDLSPSPGSKRKRKRLGMGIGSGKGKTAGKGHKGQKARAGRSVSPVFEGGQMPLVRRIPKRGFGNSRHAVVFETINVSELETRFESGASISREELMACGLAGRRDKVKILGSGEVTKSFTVKADAFSAAAKAKIEAAGGKAEVI